MNETLSEVRPENVRAALAKSERPSPSGAASASLIFGWRGLLKIKHVPEQLIDATIGPVLLLVSFTYLFGGAIEGSSREYLQFVLPGILVLAVLFTTVYSGIALNADMTKSVVDRFRSLPVWRPAPLVGAVLGDAVRYILAATVIVVTGLLMGFDAEGGVTGLILGAGLVVVFAFAVSWVFTTMGLVLRSANAVQGGGMMLIFSLVFLSNVFVDPTTMPSLLEDFVALNPIAHLVRAVRGLIAGDVSTPDVILVLAEAAVVTAVFGGLTARLYNRGA